jgi:outer membrane protein assembly factor BamB
LNPKVLSAFVCSMVAGCTSCALLQPDATAGLQTVHVWWSASIPALGPPALDDHLVYFTLRDHRFAAVDRATGAIRWITPSGIPGSNLVTQAVPVRTASTVVFGDYELFGVDTATGSIVWIFGSKLATDPGTGVYVFKTDGAHIYAGSTIGSVFALDAATGALLWRDDLMPGNDSQARIMAVRDGRVYVYGRYGGPRYSGRVYALDAADGTVAWSFDRPRVSPLLATGTVDGVLTEPDALGQSLFVASFFDGAIIAFDAATGTPRWTIPGVSSDTMAWESHWLAASGNSLFVTFPGPDLISVFDLVTGEERWTQRSDRGSPFDQEPSTDATLGFVILSDGTMGAYDLNTGQRRWLRQAPTGFFDSAPVESHDTLFVAGWDAAFAIQR